MIESGVARARGGEGRGRGAKTESSLLSFRCVRRTLGLFPTHMERSVVLVLFADTTPTIHRLLVILDPMEFHSNFDYFSDSFA